MTELEDVQDLKLSSIIGFDGNAMGGLKVHPNGEHLIYPFGVKVAIHSLKAKKQRYLEGHSNVITTVAVSKTGKFIASGQVNHMGFKAPVFVWNFCDGSVKISHESHKVRVENVAFSHCERYIISLGGKDDSNVVVYDIESQDVICGVFSSNKNAGDALTLGTSYLRNKCFISGGVYTLKVWTMDPANRSVSGIDVQTGKIRRKLSNDDSIAWCGTSTGDIMKIKLNFSKNVNNQYPESRPTLIGCYAKHPLKKRKPLDTDLWVLGVRALLLLDGDKMIIGGGSGAVDLVSQKEIIMDKHSLKSSGLSTPTFPLFIKNKSCFVGDLVTSLALLVDKKNIIVGNLKCEIYIIDLTTFRPVLYMTCHTEAIYDIAFPSNYSNVFATASKNDVRLWDINSSKELLRITVPNFTCASVVFSYDGKSVLTGWNDGAIRAFTPQSGKLIYTILNAHNKGVSAIGITHDGKKLVSGGVEGQVRIWFIRREVQKLLAVLKEHKGPVSSIHISPNGKEAASASTDGSCIIWDIEKCVRLAIMFSTTLFLCIRYHPSGCQLLTTGTNRLIGYWETFDGSLIREIEGSRSSALNTLAVSSDGQLIVSGGNDQFVKVWLYKEGIPTHVGLGHGAVITCVQISPDGKTIVTASADGAIFIWKTPRLNTEEDDTSQEKLLNVVNLEGDTKSMERKSSSSSLRSQKIEKTREEEMVAQNDLEVAQKEMDNKNKNKLAAGDAPENSKSIAGVKCYCKQGCMCDNQNMPKSPKSEFDEARDNIRSNLASGGNNDMIL